jgi:hypothetical protein
VPSLREVQAGVRRAVVSGDPAGVAPLLVGGRDARRRLAVHSRHYHASLVQVVVDRYPATVWLVGVGLVTDAARTFVVAHPPTRPCLAEYGAGFPAFLSERPGAAALPYLRDFSELEWGVGAVAVEIDHRAAAMDLLAAMAPDTVADACLSLQPGARYISTSWSVDELMTLYLTESEPDRFVVTPGDIGLEVRGARGDVRISRLSRGDFAFRSALANGSPLGDAAERALAADDAFDPGRALVAAVAGGLVTGARTPGHRSPR